MTVAALRWFKAALVLQLLLLGYWLTIEVVHLSPWNDLAARPADYDLGQSIALNALQLVVYSVLFSFGSQALATLALLGFAGYLGWQLWMWWKPFAMGADAAYQAYYAANFSHTLKVIPTLGARIPPDAQHLTLHLLALLVVFATAMAVARMQHL
jgi:hypothetical protein